MAERKISGDDMLLQIDPAGGTSYKIIVCAINTSLSNTSDEIDASTKCGPDIRPGKQKSSFSIDGAGVVDPDTGRVSSADLFTLWQNKTTFTWKYSKATPVTDDIIKTGSGSILSFEESANYGEDWNFSATIGVSGDIVQTIQV